MSWRLRRRRWFSFDSKSFEIEEVGDGSKAMGKDVVDMIWRKRGKNFTEERGIVENRSR